MKELLIGFVIGMIIMFYIRHFQVSFIKSLYKDERKFNKELIKSFKLRFVNIKSNFETMDEYTFSKIGRKNIIKELNELIVILGENDENR